METDRYLKHYAQLTVSTETNLMLGILVLKRKTLMWHFTAGSYLLIFIYLSTYFIREMSSTKTLICSLWADKFNQNLV